MITEPAMLSAGHGRNKDAVAVAVGTAEARTSLAMNAAVAAIASVEGIVAVSWTMIERSRLAVARCNECTVGLEYNQVELGTKGPENGWQGGSRGCL